MPGTPDPVQSSQLKFVDGNTTTTTTQATRPVAVRGFANSVHVYLTGTGALTATALVQVSNIDDATANQWITASTLSLSGTTHANDGATLSSAWKWVRVNITAVTGTGATLSVYPAGGAA